MRDQVERYFHSLPFTGTCLSLDDFDETYNFYFEDDPKDFNIDYLVSFCEYCYNLVKVIGIIERNQIRNHIEKVIDLIGYKKIERNGLAIFVEASKAANSVSEIVSSTLAYEALEYNHHSLKGNLEEKKRILANMANYVEPKQQELNSILPKLRSDLFYLFNNYNIRHNNKDSGKAHNPILDNMSASDIEQIYDDTYQMWLLAILLLDHQERELRIRTLRENHDK